MILKCPHVMLFLLIFSRDGKFIVCGSEDHSVYIWRTQHELQASFTSASRRDRSDFWESFKGRCRKSRLVIKFRDVPFHFIAHFRQYNAAHNNTVTVAQFFPKPELVIKSQFKFLDSDDKHSNCDVRGEVLLSADYNGTMRIFLNKFKPGSG